MARYFFHTEDGRCLPDASGVELPDLAAVRTTALKVLCEMSHVLSDELWKGESMRIQVQDDSGMTLMSLDVSVTLAPSLQPARRPDLATRG